MTARAGSWAGKLHRALKHFEEANAVITAFLASNPYRVVFEHDPATIDEYLVTMFVEADPPAELSLLIGDCVYNFRSSLDHLAWGLVRQNGQTPTNRTEFPIFLHQAEYAKSKRDGKPARGSGPLKGPGHVR